MEGNYFKDIIYKMNTRFNEPKIKNKNTLVITREDFKSLSSFELQTINTIAQIYDLIKNNEVISFDTLISVVNKLAKHGTDAEKIYLLGLFFPEKLKAMNIHQLNPFPIPTHTLHQEFTFNIIPNAFGNFVVQLVCPLLCDTSVAASKSNLYVCTDAGLNGTATISGQSAVIGTTWTAYGDTKVPTNNFKAYILLAAKITCVYSGRVDSMSGYMGASYNLSSNALDAVDTSASIFDYINKSINSCIQPVSLEKGISVVYFPPDFTYLAFSPVFTSTSTTLTQTNSRLNIYGTGLPLPAAGGNAVVLRINFVFIFLNRFGMSYQHLLQLIFIL
jgi:hypothetical protein